MEMFGIDCFQSDYLDNYFSSEFDEMIICKFKQATYFTRSDDTLKILSLIKLILPFSWISLSIEFKVSRNIAFKWKKWYNDYFQCQESQIFWKINCWKGYWCKIEIRVCLNVALKLRLTYSV